MEKHRKNLRAMMVGLMVLAIGVGCGGSTTPDDKRCHAPASVSGSPRSSQEAIALLNALPKPTNVACFVESLDRPLAIFATSSTVSAQPALSARSPRVFLRFDQLILSVAIEGDSSRKIEFGDLIAGETRSIKGELLLPVTEPVARGALYDRVLDQGRTVCGFCHGDEQPVSSIDFAHAYSSLAYRPNVQYQVPLTSLAHENEICDPVAEPGRCAMLSAIFDGVGEVVDAQFSNAMTLFY